MNRRLKLALSFGAAAALAIPAAVLAQLPPDPPATFYGTVASGTTGQGVVAIVLSGGTSTVCGTGTVLNSGGPVYVVDVVSNAQTTGCGVNGRSVRFYFTPTASAGGRLASETATWTGAGPKQQNLTLGAELVVRGRIPLVASDKVNF